MAIELLDPVGEVEGFQKVEERLLETLAGKRVGYVFNQHTSALVFWRALEKEVDARLAPAGTHRLYKVNTWASAPKDEVARLVQASDYALVGVGA